MRQSKYSLLNNPNWLREKYTTDGLSTEQIAQLVGCPSCSSVSQSLRRHNIDMRSKSEGHRANREDDGFVVKKDVVEGCLLGDGALKTDNCYSNDSYPLFSKRNIHHDHIKYVGELLFGNNADNRIKLMNNTTNLGNGKIYSLTSLTHPELMKFYRAWYPASNDYKKVIPESIEITADLLLHWFLDDGYSYKYTRQQKYTYTRLEFACMSFTVEELEMLCAKIYNKFRITMFVRVHKRNGKIAGTGCEVHVKQSDIPLFFEIIGDCPVKSMQYKWK